MKRPEDLRRAIRTAHEHCAPGGAALFAPDYTAETFRPDTSHGGHDRGGRSLRYLEWEWASDTADGTYTTLMVYVMREGDGSVRCVEDRHLCGLFGRDDWLRMIAEAGFTPRSIPFEHSEIGAGSCGVFLGLKPRDVH